MKKTYLSRQNAHSKVSFCVLCASYNKQFMKINKVDIMNPGDQQWGCVNHMILGRNSVLYDCAFFSGGTKCFWYI
jgi:hypothetical protein